jgi:hypothetical protein
MAQPHQVNIDDISTFKVEHVLASSSADSKKLVVRVTAKVTDFVVTKDGLVQVFTNLAAAVKRYNG